MLFYCPAGVWKTATIAEFLFIRLFRDCGFLHLRISGKMCRFLQSANARSCLDFIGVLWNSAPTARPRFDGRRVRSFLSSRGCGDTEVLVSVFYLRKVLTLIIDSPTLPFSHPQWWGNPIESASNKSASAMQHKAALAMIKSPFSQTNKNT
ncbi:hypothetical protein [Paraburkholderia sp. BL27I4N3]|uniref:hypothetical protein n=1 Tax=Paraburkholderia sp. BL27I4N3 TaxID=1938805 RepID=UPI0011C01D6A|nr:hypothetical protein [Paraburkholderia sp. BL27I4N3]